jgi:hypothetical protein
MTAMPQGPWTAPPPSRWGAGRIVALVLGLLLLLPALGLIVGGGVLLWVHHGNRTDGFVFSESDSFSTEGYALVSERIDLATGADWVPLSATLGTARAEVTGADPGTEIFVGIAPESEGAAYLDGVEHSVVDDLGTTATDESRVPGGEPSGPPVDQDFWVAQASGTGTQRLDWEPAEGNWLFVAMNADGSAGVAIDARIGATVPALDGLAWGVLVAGLVLLAIGLLVVTLALALRRPARAGPPAGAYGPGARPWTPPPPVDRTTAADDRPGAETSAPWRPPTS